VGGDPGVEGTVEPEADQTVEPHVERLHGRLGQRRTLTDQPPPVAQPVPQGDQSVGEVCGRRSDALGVRAVVDADHRREHACVDPRHGVEHPGPLTRVRRQERPSVDPFLQPLEDR
jgi:hypothetical protein